MAIDVNVEMHWLITFENGYCGCDVTEQFVGTYLEAKDFAEDYLPDYAEQYAYVHFGWDNEYDEEEFEDYKEDCGYSIELDPEWYEEEEEEGLDD